METLYAAKREVWRAWLEKNGHGAREIWLVYYKKGSGKPRVAYRDAVEEAICFGWIDGTVKKIDEQRFAQKFTPRKPSSRWSKLNIGRARKMIREGKMTARGLAVFNPANQAVPHPSEMPAELEKLFKKQTLAWANFQNFPPYYRRITIAWVSTAKKEETRIKRLQQLVEYSTRGQKIKFM